MSQLKVFAKRQIDTITAQAWFSESKQLEEKVTKISLQTGFTSEYTRMVLCQNPSDKPKHTVELTGMRKAKKTLSWKNGGSKEDWKKPLNDSTTVGFGNVIATEENATPFIEEKKAESNEVMNKMTICCTRLSYCCCPCFLRVCSRVNDECALVTTQLCAALSCLACIKFCIEVCDS